MGDPLVYGYPDGPAEKCIPVEALTVAVDAGLVVECIYVQVAPPKQEIVGGYYTEQGSEYTSQEQQKRLVALYREEYGYHEAQDAKEGDKLPMGDAAQEIPRRDRC